MGGRGDSLLLPLAAACISRIRVSELAEPLPILGNNTTSQPIRGLFLYSSYISTTKSPLLPHCHYNYRNNQLPYPYYLRRDYHPKMGKSSLIDFARFRVKGCNHTIPIAPLLKYVYIVLMNALPDTA